MYFLLFPSLLRPPQVDFPKLLCTSLFRWTWPHGFTGTAPTNTFNPACFSVFWRFFFSFFKISSTVLHSLSGIKDHPQHHFHSPLKTHSTLLRGQRQDCHTTRGAIFCLSNVKKHLFLVLGRNTLSISVCVCKQRILQVQSWKQLSNPSLRWMDGNCWIRTLPPAGFLSHPCFSASLHPFASLTRDQP